MRTDILQQAQAIRASMDAEAADRYKQMETELEDLKNQQEVDNDANAE